VKVDSFADIFHQLVEGLSLRETIDTDAPTAPVFTV